MSSLFLRRNVAVRTTGHRQDADCKANWQNVGGQGAKGRAQDENPRLVLSAYYTCSLYCTLLYLFCATQIVNGPEVMNKFVGQSEQNVRDLFKV